MSLAKNIRRWVPLLVLIVVAFGSWQAAQAADTDNPSVISVAYENELGTPLISARRIPETLQAPVADDAIQPAIGQFLSGLLAAQSDVQSCLSIEVDGRQLVNEGANLALIPASNQKLLTTYAALLQFGSNATFATTVYDFGSVADGVLDGDLYLVGGGDPFLISDDWRSQYDVRDEAGDVIPPEYIRPWSRLEDLADDIAASGITSITGSLIGDETLFDLERQGPWAERLIAQNQSGPLSALTVNEGFVRWGADNPAASLRTRADQPALNAVNVLARLLRDRGVTIRSTSVGEKPPGGNELARLESPPMSELILHVNSWSSNYGAEILVKQLGLAVNEEGSTAAGVAAVRAILGPVPELSLQGLVINDGSGLAETNRLTCPFLNDLLTVAGFDSILSRSLAIGGERGSLALKHVDTVTDGNLFAKTGTLNPTTALSGFLVSPEDPDVVLLFSYISNAELVGQEVKDLQEPFIESLTNYPDAPDIEVLDPLDPVPSPAGG